MSRVSQLRDLSDEQLSHEVREIRQQLFRLRFQAASERSDVPGSVKRLRRTIARILTIQRERELTVK